MLSRTPSTLFRLGGFRRRKGEHRFALSWIKGFLVLFAIRSTLQLRTELLAFMPGQSSETRFPRAGLVQGEDGVFFFVKGRTCARLTNFWECGEYYGDLRQRLPFFGTLPSPTLSKIGNWSKQVRTGPTHQGVTVFQCSKHTDHIVKMSIRELPSRWMIISPPRYAFLANLFAKVLERYEFIVSFSSELSYSHAEHDMHIVIATRDIPVSLMPPSGKRIVAQLDPSLSDASPDYIHMLQESDAVIEFSLYNIQLLRAMNVHSFRIWHHALGMDLGQSRAFGEDKIWDLMSFQDLKRATGFLSVLEADLHIKVVHETDDNVLSELLWQSKFALSLCHSPTASLDVAYIAKSLSLGVPVIAESCAPDEVFFEEVFKSSVLFFERGSVPSMTRVLRNALTSSHNQRTRDIQAVVSSSLRRFTHSFNRVLFGTGRLSLSMFHDIFTETSNFELGHEGTPVLLSLPESPERRLRDTWPESFAFSRFDGVRLLTRPSWISTGLSYKAIATAALNHDYREVTIAEDDVVLPAHYRKSYRIIREYLHRNTEWDIFSGLLADVPPDTRVIAAECYRGIQFITIDRMISMVFNTYNHKMLLDLSVWDPLQDNQDTNTIDKYLGTQADLRVICALPFYVDHAEIFNSTIWGGILNTAYSSNIVESEKRLYGLLADFTESHHRESDATSEICTDTPTFDDK